MIYLPGLVEVVHLFKDMQMTCLLAVAIFPNTVSGLTQCILSTIEMVTTTVWWSGCQTASAKKKLSKVQRLACLGITGVICMTPTGAMEALIGLPPLELVIQGVVRSVAHRLWSFGCWSYLHPPTRT